MRQFRVRNTARAVVCKNGKLLIMERWRRDSSGKMLHYYSIPGGGIEEGETGEQTVVRELREETGVVVRPIRLLIDQKQPDGCRHYYYWCEHISGEPTLQSSSEEAIAQNENNIFEPKWVPLKDVLPESVHFEYAPFVEYLPSIVKNNGFMPVNKAR